jgi:hypothetical protein
MAELLDRCKLWDEFQLGVEIDQLVAQTGEHHAPGIGAALGRVQKVGVVLDTDAQCASGVGRHGGREKRQTDSGGGPASHDLPLMLQAD